MLFPEPGTISLVPPAGGAEAEEAKSEVGRAIKITPMKATIEPIFSMRVKGSLMRKEQAQQDKEGARKVMTVASAIGRYSNESGSVSDLTLNG